MVLSKACDFQVLNGIPLLCFKTAGKSNHGEVSHHSNTKASTKRYDYNVKKTTQIFDSQFTDPFNLTNPSTHLTKFATNLRNYSMFISGFHLQIMSGSLTRFE